MGAPLVSMACRAEVLVFKCRKDDLAVLRSASGSKGPALRIVETRAEFGREAVAYRAVALFLGIGSRTLADLDMIPLIRAVRSDLPVVVIADEDSLDLERCARQAGIFYYLVHPIGRSEVEAVLKDVMRCAAG